jgi:hypothetical protein
MLPSIRRFWVVHRQSSTYGFLLIFDSSAHASTVADVGLTSVPRPCSCWTGTRRTGQRFPRDYARTVVDEEVAGDSDTPCYMDLGIESVSPVGAKAVVDETVPRSKHHHSTGVVSDRARHHRPSRGRVVVDHPLVVVVAGETEVLHRQELDRHAWSTVPEGIPILMMAVQEGPGSPMNVSPSCGMTWLSAAQSPKSTRPSTCAAVGSQPSPHDQQLLPPRLDPRPRQGKPVNLQLPHRGQYSIAADTHREIKKRYVSESDGAKA